MDHPKHLEDHRMALAEAGTIPILIDLMNDVDEVEELRDNDVEALVNYYVDPLYHDRVSDAIKIPSFRNMHNKIDSYSCIERAHG
ncbi:hypothetical protein JHK84_056366 [Glycine max]|nr:hypothetical protein JHK84_056366 [Glycine max]